MEGQVYFVIEGKELVLDKILVEYNEMPLFFVCRNERAYYICTCVDVEEEQYMVVPILLSALSKMLLGKMTMRDLNMQAEGYWEVLTGEDTQSDQITWKNFDEFSTDCMPYEGQCLNIITRDLKEYVKDINVILLNEGLETT